MPATQKPKSYKKRHDPTASPSATSGSTATTPSAAAGPSRPKGPKPMEQRDPAGIPGISKLKGSIRQTKRLLAKDNLEPGLRISTQRRLTSLEADLAMAEKRNVEKKNGTKYHMIKFFERQKLNRLIKKAKKKMADESVSSSKRKAAEEDLFQARVMLNYILHYPNEQKYIALFPPSASGETDESAKSKLPPHLKSSRPEPTDKTDKSRLDILRSIQGKMERGEVSGTPEEEGRGDKVAVDVAGKTTSTKATAKAADKEEDDFFENE